MKFNEKLEALLKSIDKFTDKHGVLLKQNIKDASEKFDSDLIQLLFNDNHTKAHFFYQIGGATVFNYRKFIDYIEDKNFLIDSYTKFSNKVGLTISNKHIQQMSEVVLSFPFKDCVLEGGQSKDDEKRKEIFFNEVLAKDEINRLLNKKVITNAKKYTQNGASDTVTFNRDKNGLIKDNLIIKGNNLLALHSLKSNFAGKVKLIYIDPPYNTGNDSFNYNDNFNHSTWLTFMKNRLEVAREMLRDDGVIFVQCDDNEQAYLKVLMDEIFNFKECIAVKTSTPSGVNAINVKRGEQMFKLKEYLLFYSKQNSFRFYPQLIKTDYKINYKYEVAKEKNGYSVTNLSQKMGKSDLIQYCLKNYKNIFSLEKNNKKAGEKIKIAIEESKNTKEVAEFLNSRQELKLIYDGGIFVPLEERIVKENGKAYFGVLISDFWDDDTFQTNSTEGGISFNNAKKPEKLLQRIINLTTKEGDIVLDYHLGSGTTCAVAHKMDRQYIGIEQMDYIKDVTIKRMQKVINGEQGGISKRINWQGGGEFIYFELDKYNQIYIDNLNAIKQGHGTVKTIEQLYDEIIQYSFLNYDIDGDRLLKGKTDFLELNLNMQLEFLISILNKNQLYKNLSEIDDKDLGVNRKIKKINNDFYNNRW